MEKGLHPTSFPRLVSPWYTLLGALGVQGSGAFSGFLYMGTPVSLLCAQALISCICHILISQDLLYFDFVCP